MMMQELTIKLPVNEEQAERLERLRRHRKLYTSKDGGHPFGNQVLADTFESVMQVGCRRTIDWHIQAMEEMYGIEKCETPAAGTAGESG